MNWDALGAGAEIAGALAVVVSIAYLAIQIRRQTEESRLTATRELLTQWDQVLDLIVSDDELSDLYLRAVRDYEALPNTKRLRASLLFQRILRIRERSELHVSQSHLDPATYESMVRANDELLSFPGVQQWWDGSRGFFEASFQERVDTKIEEAKRKGYDSSFKREADQLEGPSA